jgi:rhodanese-related sulfurtransferase
MNTKKYGILPVVNVLKYLNFSLIFLLAGCWWSTTNPTSKLVMINVLDPDYYQDCHITGSVNIPFEQFEERIRTLDKNDRYVLYCSNYACTAAPFAGGMLKEAGFANVSVLPGGIVEWYQKGYPCTGTAQRGYLTDVNERLADDDYAGVTSVSAEALKDLMTQEKLI